MDDAQLSELINRRGFGRAISFALSNAPTAPLAQITPATQTPEGDVQPALPGLITSVYGGLGAGVPSLINTGAQKLGVDLNIPSAPGAETALRQYEGTKDLVRGIIKPSEPQNEQEQMLRNATEGATGMISPIPGAALAGLPTAARIAANIVVPTKEAMKVAVPLGAAGSLTLEGLAKAAEPTADFRLGGHAQEQGPVADFRLSQDGPQADFRLDGQTPHVDFSESAGSTGVPFWKVGLGVLAGGAAAWTALRHGGKVWTDASNMIRTGETSVRAAETVRNTRFNQDLTNFDPLNQSVNARPLEAPLPGEAALPGTKFVQDYVNSNALVSKYYKAIATSPNAAKDFEANLGRINGNQSMQRIIGNLFRTGVDEFSGQTMPSLKQWGDKIQALPDDMKDLLNTAMWAKDEVNTRTILFNRNAASNNLGPIPDERLNFRNSSLQELHAKIAQAEGVPEVKAIMDEAWTLSKRNLDIALARGYISRADYNTLVRERPNHVASVGLDGRVLRTLGERDLTPGSGWEAPPTTAWSAVVQHQDRLFRDMAQNEWMRVLFKRGLNYQAVNPQAAKLFEEKTYMAPATNTQLAGNPNAAQRSMFAEPNPAERSFTIRDFENRRTILVNNSAMYTAIDGPPAWYNMWNGVFQNSRRWVQSGSTGTLSLATPKFFPLTTLARNTQALSSYAPQGTYGGLMDMAKQRAYGGGRYMGPDPTNYVMAPLSTAQDVSQVVAKHAGEGLLRPGNPMGETLRAIMGDTWTDGLGNWLLARYEQSALQRQHAGGMGGEGAQGGVELPTMTLRGQDVNARNAMGSQVPGLMGETKIPFTDVVIPSSISHTSINMHRFIRDIFETVSNGANSYHFKLNEYNPNLSRTRLLYESSRLFGQPGEMGASRAAHVMGTVPFVNAATQNIARGVEQFRNNPIGFLANGAIMSMAIPALGEIYSAMFSGPEHVQHLANKVDMRGLSTAVNIYLGQGTDPNHHVEIALPQEWGFMYPIILEGLATITSAFRAHHDEGLKDRILDTLGDLFSHHVSTSISDASLYGATNAFAFMPPFQVPPIISGTAGAISGLTTGEVAPTRVDPYKFMQNVINGNPWFAGAGAGGSVSRDLPGQTQHDKMLSNNDSQVMQAVINSFLGSLSGAYATVQGRANEKWEDFWPDLKEDYIQRFKDNTPLGTVLWDNNLRQSTRTPLIDNNYRMLDKMKEASGAASAMQNYGRTRAGGLPILPANPPKWPSDPMMRQAFIDTGKVYGVIESKLMPMARDIQKQMDSIRDSTHSAETKRYLMNALSDRLLEKHKLIAQHIADLESGLSVRFNAPVSMLKIDFNKGPEQFTQ